MDMRFLRGNPQAPKGHAIFIARSTTDSRTVYCTYCIVPPTPLSLTKYLPSFLAAQLPPEELREAANVNVMPIPPMLEEGSSLEHLQMLAERRDDDLCDLGSINPRDEGARMQLVAEGCQEYGQLYLNYTLTFERVASTAQMDQLDEPDAPKGTHVFDQSNHDKKSTKQTKQELYHILSSLSIVPGCKQEALNSRSLICFAYEYPKKLQLCTNIGYRYSDSTCIYEHNNKNKC